MSCSLYEKGQQGGESALYGADTSGNLSLIHISVGDNILQDALLEAGKENEETWNYDALYAQVAGDIQAADLAAVNQETPLVNDHKDVSGSGLMGTPLEVGDARCV